MSHTPGPWKSELGRLGQFYVRNARNWIIAEVSHRPNKAARANANLIAAAPEMLEALEALVNLGCHYGSKRDEVVNALAVIVKAKGESL